jgi:hypothetical protein
MTAGTSKSPSRSQSRRTATVGEVTRGGIASRSRPVPETVGVVAAVAVDAIVTTPRRNRGMENR